MNLHQQYLKNLEYIQNQIETTNLKVSQAKYHYLYQITNNINGKIYIGRRSTDTQPQLDDYMGSGVNLERALNKYGKENFTKDIIHYCDTFAEICALERTIVNIDFINREDTYNLMIGGTSFGQFSKESREKLSNTQKQRFIDNPNLRIEVSNISKITQNRPETSQAKSNSLVLFYSKPENKVKKSRISSALYEDKDYYERSCIQMKEIGARPEIREGRKNRLINVQKRGWMTMTNRNLPHVLYLYYMLDVIYSSYDPKLSVWYNYKKVWEETGIEVTCRGIWQNLETIGNPLEDEDYLIFKLETSKEQYEIMFDSYWERYHKRNDNPKPKGMSTESKQSISSKAKERQSLPWKTGSVVSNPDRLFAWSILDILYDNKDNFKSSYSKLCRYMKSTYKIHVTITMYEWILKEDPRLNQDWIQFKSEYELMNLKEA